MRGLLILLFLPGMVFAGNSSLALAYQHYKKGNFSESLKISGQYLKKSPAGKHSDKILYIYVTSETSLYRIDKSLDKFHRPGNSRFYYLAVYRAMERALVLGNHETGLKWGQIFYREAGQQDFYGKGLYLYSCILYSAKKNTPLIKKFLQLDIDRYSRSKIQKIVKTAG